MTMNPEDIRRATAGHTARYPTTNPGPNLRIDELLAWIEQHAPGLKLDAWQRDILRSVYGVPNEQLVTFGSVRTDRGNRDRFPRMSDEALIRESHRLLLGEIRRAERNLLGEIRKVRRQMADDTSALGQELDGIETDETAEETQISAVQAEIKTLEDKAANGSISGEEHQRLDALKASIEADTATLSGLASGGVDGTPVVTDPATPADPSDPAVNDGTETSAPTA